MDRALIAALLASCAVGCRERVAQSTDAGAQAKGHTRDATLPQPKAPKRLFARKQVARVRKSPSLDAPQLGYLRAGATLTSVSGEPVGHDRCLRGWYEIRETGGFVCDGREVIAFEGSEPPERQPAPPNRAGPLPYRYAYNRKEGTPMYKRVPSEIEALFWEDGILVPEAGLPQPSAEDSPADGGAPTPRSRPLTLAELSGEHGSVVRRKLNRGFHVSIDRELEGPSGRRYLRTMSSGYIPASRMVSIEGTRFHGVQLPASTTSASTNTPLQPTASSSPLPPLALPLGVVVDPDGADSLRRVGGKAVPADRLAYHTFFAIAGHARERNHDYVAFEAERLVRADQIAEIRAAERPAAIPSGERWIDIDLSRQTLVAYESERAVFATLVSTGRVRNDRNPAVNSESPKGVFRLLSKHVSATMDGDHAAFGAYSLEDVPWVQFFKGAYALHGAFWHDRFGRPASHGCINLAPNDARWLFDWTTPQVPGPWHAAYPERRGEGTWVSIHGETPRG